MLLRLSGRLMALLVMAAVALVGCATAKQTPQAAAPAPAAMASADADGDGVTDDKDACPGTRAGAKVDSKGCEIILELSGVNFAFNSADLSPAATSALDSVVSRLQFHSVKRVEIAGHTDSTGPESYNQQLSERRAQAVADYMEKNGIEWWRMNVVGHGESQPVASNDTREGRAQNRRVQIIDLTAR